MTGEIGTASRASLSAVGQQPGGHAQGACARPNPIKPAALVTKIGSPAIQRSLVLVAPATAIGNDVERPIFEAPSHSVGNW
jgi:hypothetical protein